MEKDIVIIGGGLTGLSTAINLKKKGFNIIVLEKTERLGGQIQTFHENDFVFESGPNTGSGASEEVLNLFDELSTECKIEFAKKESEKRLIWKNEKFHPLPNGLWSGITTPLFRFSDKLHILGEPWRAKGNNPNETVAELTTRRLGKSFVDYAVDPFLSGIYAGDATTLITRHALPKLYNLEQDYGSFIGGAIKKAQKDKNQKKSQSKKGIFSTNGGMENLVKAMIKYIGKENIMLSCKNIATKPNTDDGTWKTSFKQNNQEIELISKHLITTVGSYVLPEILKFIEIDKINKITNLRYAPIVQIAVGVKDTGNLKFNAFGGLISSKDNEDFLGILFPSSCFEGRSPNNGALFSFFMGGIKNAALTELSDYEIEEKVVKTFHRMLGFPASKEPDLIRIFRHKHAIPQYEISSEDRFNTVKKLEKSYQGLHIAGNLRDGIGMAHRIIQGARLAEEIK